MAWYDWMEEDLTALDQSGLLRRRRCITSLPNGECEVEGRRLKNFAGNDYLNLSHDPRMLAACSEDPQAGGTGVTASAPVSGYSPWHRQLEQDLARFFDQESAILFPTGFAANLGTIAALAGPEDVLFCDRLNHACLIDGCKLSGARFRIYRHHDLDRLSRELEKATGFRRKWIVTDGIFSMDGDAAPLDDLCDLAERYEAQIIVDEAHGFGVMGEAGRGVTEFFREESRVAVRIGTLSKAAASLGGFVVGPQQLTDFLWNHARTQMFSTALPVPVCRAAICALKIMSAEPRTRWHVNVLANKLRDRLRSAGFDVPESQGPIVPVILQTPERTLKAAATLETAGYLVAAIRPPTVPYGTSRLRITVTAAACAEDLEGICRTLSGIAE